MPPNACPHAESLRILAETLQAIAASQAQLSRQLDSIAHAVTTHAAALDAAASNPRRLQR